MLAAVAALAWLAALPFQTAALPQEPRQTFRSATNLVTIQASVRDDRGRPIGGLKTSDFEVRDNDLSKPVLSLRADRHAPVSLAVLVDMSGSMAVAPKIAMARRVFSSLLSQLRDGEDEVALFTFDSSLRERHPFTGSIAGLKSALDEFAPFGSTSLYDAAGETARRIAARRGTHKAIIVITDGTDTSSTLTAPQLSGLASSIDVPVFIVVTVPAVDKTAIKEDAERSAASVGADLRELADWTGGQLVFANGLLETDTVAFTLVDELRQQYVLAIEAAAGPEWRRLQVRVKRPATIVRARSGYYGG